MPRSRVTIEPPIYTFRVRVLGGGYAPPDLGDVWREIEVAANQTLADLGNAIPAAFDFEDMHLWSFFLSGKPWDRRTEYALIDDEAGPFDGPSGKATRTLIRDVPYPTRKGKEEFLYLFDYGDEWYFGVTLVGTAPTAGTRARYPRLAARHGTAPVQYPDLDDEEWDEDEEDEAEVEESTER
jgi:Plasmid pRiA4b ORF-3-like protein